MHKVVSKALAIVVPTEKRYCGLIHLFLVLDSDLEVPEISERNNIGHKQVTIICPSGE